MGDKYLIKATQHGVMTELYKNGEVMKNVVAYKVEGAWNDLTKLTLVTDLEEDDLIEIELDETVNVEETH